MKKTLFITLGILILLLALLAWGYLFLFGTPESSDDFFADLGFSISSQPTIPLPTEEFIPAPEAVVNVEGNPLRQITFRPVAGFVGTSDNGVLGVRYAEKGSGHVYDINLDSGAEARVSNTTNARITKAAFSPEGEHVAMQSEVGYETTTFAGTITNPGEGGSIESSSLPPNLRNLSFVGTSTLHFTTTQQSFTTGYQHNVLSRSQSEVFSVPFLSITSDLIGSKFYVTNRHAPELYSNIFTAEETSVQSQMSQQFGLTAELSEKWFAYSYNEDNEVLSEALNRDTTEVTQLPLPIIPEKCVFSALNPDTLWCAAPLTQISHTFIKEWYQGATRSNDSLWQVSLSSGTARLVNNPTTAIGREVDITDISLSENETSLFFINKNDDTLWQYDFLAE